MSQTTVRDDYNRCPTLSIGRVYPSGGRDHSNRLSTRRSIRRHDAPYGDMSLNKKGCRVSGYRERIGVKEGFSGRGVTVV